MSATDQLLSNAQAYAERFAKGDLPRRPARKVAIVTCMDARIDPYGLLGLEEGDAHVVRNAGGMVTTDVIRSLAISQRILGTEEVVLIHHTDCGMLGFDDEEFRESLEDETGVRPEWNVQSITNLDDDLRESVSRIRDAPFITKKDSVRGFVYEVETGRLREVT